MRRSLTLVSAFQYAMIGVRTSKEMFGHLFGPYSEQAAQTGSLAAVSLCNFQASYWSAAPVPEFGVKYPSGTKPR